VFGKTLRSSHFRVVFHSDTVTSFSFGNLVANFALGLGTTVSLLCQVQWLVLKLAANTWLRNLLPPFCEFGLGCCAGFGYFANLVAARVLGCIAIGPLLAKLVAECNLVAEPLMLSRTLDLGCSRLRNLRRHKDTPVLRGSFHCRCDLVAWTIETSCSGSYTIWHLETWNLLAA
jgi:hypothetical protein